MGPLLTMSPDVALPITFQKDQLPSGTESAFVGENRFPGSKVGGYMEMDGDDVSLKPKSEGLNICDVEIRSFSEAGFRLATNDSLSKYV